MDSWKSGNNRTHPTLIFNHTLVPDRRSCGMKEMQWGEPWITLKHTSCVHLLDGEGGSGSVIVVRGLDLPRNKNALSGSQSSPGEVKSLTTDQVREAWGTRCEIHFPLGVPGYIRMKTFPCACSARNVWQQKCWYMISKKAKMLQHGSRCDL